MKKLLVMCVLLLACETNHTPEEGIAICHTVCGDRPLDEYATDNAYGFRISCRCGKLELECDGGCCKAREHY